MKRLIVLAPGLSGFERWPGLIDRLTDEPTLSGARWLRWDHGKRVFSGGRPDQLAQTLSARIDQEWAKSGPFDDIILVGHSMGGLLVRMAYLIGSGADHSKQTPSPWAAKVSRIILLAGMSRGVDPGRRWYLRLGIWFGRLFLPGRLRRVSSHLLRGSSTITNLRIGWIRHMARLGDEAPVVVQILGTNDALVHREDSVDVEQFANGFYIAIPDANHADLMDVESAPDPEGRYALLRDAFVNPRPQGAENVTITGPSKVVFVLHGIRANNRTWVRQTIEAIARRWPDVAPIGPTYRYFSALQFAIRPTRRKNLRWFQDQYTQALARNPSAEFSFIGHSNGTYLLGESLVAIPGMRFERVVLVGSVLPEDYCWDRIVNERKQVRSVRVDGSANDWPVAWLCSALNGIGMKDVGTGGYSGFSQLSGADAHEFFWYEGDHGAPLATENLPALAEFAVEGRVVEPTRLAAESQFYSLVSRLLRRATPALVLLGMLFLVWAALAAPLVALTSVVVMFAIVLILDII